MHMRVLRLSRRMLSSLVPVVEACSSFGPVWLPSLIWLPMNTLGPELLHFFRFDELSERGADAAALAAEILDARLRVYSPDTPILHEGERSFCVRFLKSGWAYSDTQLRDGTRQIVDIYLAGDLLEPPTVGGHSRVSVRAVDYTTLYEIPFTGLMPLLKRWPDIGDRFTAAAARHNAIHVERLISLGKRDATARTAHLLLELAERIHPGSTEIEVEFPCPLTQIDLADALGMTAIHFNRTLRDLRLLGLVVMRKGTVLISNRFRLAQLAEFSPEYLQQRPNDWWLEGARDHESVPAGAPESPPKRIHP